VKFILLVEGETESKALPGFLRRWLNEQLPERVGIKTDIVSGIKDLRTKAGIYINSSESSDYIAVIGLLDLYGLEGFTKRNESIEKLIISERQRITQNINSEKFRLFFAVHELEAWLLSQPDIFPGEISKTLSSSIKNPETVDFDEPPSKLMKRIYREKLNKRNYKKTVDGSALFSKLDPQVAYTKCPYLREMLDEMLSLAKSALS
jgi:hypothetical protein